MKISDAEQQFNLIKYNQNLKNLKSTEHWSMPPPPPYRKKGVKCQELKISLMDSPATKKNIISFMHCIHGVTIKIYLKTECK